MEVCWEEERSDGLHQSATSEARGANIVCFYRDVSDIDVGIKNYRYPERLHLILGCEEVPNGSFAGVHQQLQGC